jgi:drug/metabolite transporter (DMT)-like permease
MDIVVFLAVLAAAAAHAGWNAVIKGGGDPLVLTAILSFAAGVLGIPLLAITGLPNLAAMPWVVASVVVHIAYFGSLIQTYRYGDLGQVYPIARGGAPLMTAIGGTVLLGENLTALGWGGLLLLVAGVFLLSFSGRESLRVDPRGVGYALLTALTICAYTLVDGIGARASGNSVSYSAALFVGCGIAMLGFVLWRGGTDALARTTKFWRIGAMGGAMQVASYGTAIWAMTVAPIALVAALRETSVLFGTLIAVVVLKEPLNLVRTIAVIVIVAGLLMLRLA